MTLDYIRRLYEYNLWANDQFVDALKAISEDELRAEVESSYRSLLATFEHIVGAEWVWLQRLQGTSPTALPIIGQSFEGLEAMLDVLESERSEYLDNLTPDDLSGTLTYRDIRGTEYTNPLGDILAHVVNHSSYHRGQLATLLRQAGVTPPSTDYILWIRQQSERS